MKQVFLLFFNNSLTASVVIVVVIVARLLLCKMPRKYSYWLWLIVGVRLLFPFSFPAPMTVLKAVDAPSVQLGELPLSTMEYVALEDSTIKTRVDGMESSRSLDVLGMASIVWLAGMAVLLAYALYSFAKVHRLVSTAIRREEDVYVSENIASPFILGIFCPRIYLPSHLEETDIAYILAHERYHILRLDPIAKMFAFVFTCIYWYNPLVWLSFSLMQRDMEMSCDEYVLSRDMGIKREYGMLLVDLAEKSGSLLSPLSFGENDIKARVVNILSYRKPKRYAALACIVVVAAIAIACMGNPSVEEDGLVEPSVTEQALAEEPLDDVSVNTVPTVNPIPSVTWVVEPSMVFDRVKDMGGYAHVTDVNGTEGVFNANMVGYGQQWHGNYDPNAIVVQKDDMEGIYDFNGNEVYPISLENMDPYKVGIGVVYDLDEGKFGFGIMHEPQIGGEGYLFANDFKSISEARIFTDYYDGDGPRNMFAMEDGVLGIAHLRTNEPWFEPYAYDGMLMAIDYDSVLAPSYECHIVENGKIVADLDPDYGFNGIVNGFYQIYDNQVSDSYGISTHCGLVEARTGKRITPVMYDSAKWFQEGLCPVKYNGKWGYVNESGDPVCEYLFDDASVVYDGKAYVSIDGYYGIIDFEDTFRRNVGITYDTCTSGWEFAECLHRIEVTTDALNIRDAPEGNQIGLTFSGSTHNVYEIVEKGPYTWYRIGKDRWIADDGTWIHIFE